MSYPIMKRRINLPLLVAGLITFAFSSCQKEEFTPFDQPFVHIHHNNSDELRIQANRQEEATYYVYLSTKLRYENTTVTFEVTHGAGLTPGVDFEILTPGNSLVFAPGIFEMPIHVRWLRNTIDPQKDNTVVIRLTGADAGFNVGLPGPDGRQSKLTITKF